MRSRVAFGWNDDHLYVFWLGGKLWACDGIEHVHPFALKANPFAGWDLPMETPCRQSAEQALDRLGLIKGQRIASVFDAVTTGACV